jgi:hypothetical protein
VDPYRMITPGARGELVVREAVAAHQRQMVGCTEVSVDHVVDRRRQVWQMFADGEGADWRSGRPGRGRIACRIAAASVNLDGNTSEPTIRVTTTRVLERLAQALDHVAPELRELVEKQHTVVRQCS